MCKYHPCPFADICSLDNLVDLFYCNITRRQEPELSPAPAIDYTYTFDGMNRLSSGEDETQTYGELSNLVTKGDAKYVYQDPDDENSDQMRLASFNDGTQHEYTYDANGNPVSVSNKFSALSYDNLNLLRQIVHSQNDDYWYNWAGLRVKKTEDSGGTWKTTYTLFDGVNPLMQEVYDASGRIQTTFNIIVNGQILAQYKRVYPSTDSVVYFYVDYLGSRRVVIDASSGTAIDRYRYSAWGEATQDTGSDVYRSFTGKQYDATGLIYFNARYYDPVTGRFLTEDPAMKGINWYGYAGNNPLLNVDLNGKDIVSGTPVSSDIILEYINTLSYEQFKFNEENKLEIDYSKPKNMEGSKTYSRHIISAIHDDNTITIYKQEYWIPVIEEVPYSVNIDEKHGGAMTVGEFGENISIYISGNPNESTYLEDLTIGKFSPAELLVHELVGHAIPKILEWPNENAIILENYIRSELDLPKRYVEPQHMRYKEKE
jgi:RHS repeat-associated protein